MSCHTHTYIDKLTYTVRYMPHAASGGSSHRNLRVLYVQAFAAESLLITQEVFPVTSQATTPSAGRNLAH